MADTQVMKEILSKRAIFTWTAWQDPNHFTYVHGPKVDWFVYKKEQQTKAPLFCALYNFEPSGKTLGELFRELESLHAHPSSRGYSEIRFQVAEGSVLHQELLKAGILDSYRPDFPNTY